MQREVKGPIVHKRHHPQDAQKAVRKQTYIRVYSFLGFSLLVTISGSPLNGFKYPLQSLTLFDITFI